MARRPARFTQRDLARAFKAALQAGLHVASARIEADGAMQLVFAGAQAVASSPLNPLDKEFGCHGRH